MTESKNERSIGLLGATSVGVGAIVGGGIFVLAGVAFRAAGPGAIIAFAVNGVIAFITALSFAEMSSMFPESGGAYTFAKKVLTVRAAFGVGWVLWFAYIVAGVLYALGFAEYAVLAVGEAFETYSGSAPSWLDRRGTLSVLAVGAMGMYSVLLVRKSEGGGQVETIGKLIVFAVLLALGAWAFGAAPRGTSREGLTPFLEHGPTGLLTAMGFTFIALQGFDLIATIDGQMLPKNCESNGCHGHGPCSCEPKFKLQIAGPAPGGSWIEVDGNRHTILRIPTSANRRTPPAAGGYKPWELQK